MYLPCVATEDADTLDQLFRGTPEEVARKYIVTGTLMQTLKGITIAYEQQWLKDGKGLMAHK